MLQQFVPDRLLQTNRQIPALPRLPKQLKIRVQTRFSSATFRIGTLHNQDFSVNLVRAIYPGSFDPLTNGHLDLIERGSKIFDELIVSILRNSEKDPLFTLAERRAMLEDMVRPYGNVSVDVFEGLLVDYAMQKKAKAVLRGIRA